MKIIIDTREQTPWNFDGSLAEVAIGTLRVGDYALDGDTGFAIERKSLNDFLGTVSKGWARFQREIYRAKERGFTLPVIVEGRLEQVMFHLDELGSVQPPDHNHPRLTPAFVLKRIGELQQIGASVFFAECPQYAAAVAFAMLHERWELLKDDNDAIRREENKREN